jgi:vacuolar-type H+-ATPase subunit E/Vma4
MEAIAEGIQALARAVLSDARAEAEQILADARAKVDDLRRRTEEQAAAEREAILEHARQEAKRTHSQAIAAAQLEARTLRLARREKLLQRVFDQARQRLSAVPQWSEYDQILRQLIVEAVGHLGSDAVRIQVDGQTRAVLTDDLLAEIAGETGVPLQLGTSLEHRTGILAETVDGRRRYDNTLEARLDRRQDALRGPVYRLLMGEAP